EMEAAREWFPKRHRLIPVTREGVVEVAELKAALKKAKHRPGLVAVMAANNETGVLQPWRELAALCREHSVPFFCDAVQWLGKLPAAGLGACDFVSGSAHKFGGPRGVGFLKVPAKGRVHPLLQGGPQEEGRRAGTENVAGALALVAALEERESRIQNPESRIKTAREAFEKRLLKALPGSEILGSNSSRLWNTVAALMPEADCRQRWVVKLDKLGFAVSTGSACASGKEAPSHVLSAMGRTSAEAARVLRFSSGWETTEADWLALLGGLVKVHAGTGE
ncbi:MAG: aminotransferase class V-fold PLP-dependent enzyme, partial [Verrucomicrobia bacterium]|nr:aminotransferase class V-fold PLP-dependent enzyme [Verrucomicrobiota bacterium]